MTGIIIYQSTYGSTKQYAEWIREETGFQLFASDDPAIAWNVDTIVIGCPIVAFRPTLAGWIRRNWGRLGGKRVFLFTTSGADPAKQPLADSIERSLPEPVRAGIRLFALAGRYDFDVLCRADRLKMRIGGLVSRAVREGMRRRVDGVARENLRELLAAIKA